MRFSPHLCFVLLSTAAFIACNSGQQAESTSPLSASAKVKSDQSARPRAPASTTANTRPTVDQPTNASAAAKLKSDNAPAEKLNKPKLFLSSFADGDSATLTVANAADDRRLDVDYRCHWRLELEGKVVRFDHEGLAHEGGCLAYVAEKFPKAKFPYATPMTAALEIRPEGKSVITLGPTPFTWNQETLVSTKQIFSALKTEGWTFSPFDQLPHYGKDFYAFNGTFRSHGDGVVCVADIVQGNFENKPIEKISNTIAVEFKRAHLVRGPNHEFMITCDGVHTQKTGHSLKTAAHKKLATAGQGVSAPRLGAGFSAQAQPNTRAPSQQPAQPQAAAAPDKPVAWACSGCGTTHHNDKKKNCRECKNELRWTPGLFLSRL